MILPAAITLLLPAAATLLLPAANCLCFLPALVRARFYRLFLLTAAACYWSLVFLVGGKLPPPFAARFHRLFLLAASTCFWWHPLFVCDCCCSHLLPTLDHYRRLLLPATSARRCVLPTL